MKFELSRNINEAAKPKAVILKVLAEMDKLDNLMMPLGDLAEDDYDFVDVMRVVDAWHDFAAGASATLHELKAKL